MVSCRNFSEMTGTCERACLEVFDGNKDYFDNIIEAVMIRIERMIAKSSPPTMCRSSQQYQQWLKVMEDNTTRNREQVTLIQHLLIYHTALAIKKSCRVVDALKYMQSFHQRQRQDKFTDIDHTLRQVYTTVRIINDQLTAKLLN